MIFGVDIIIDVGNVGKVKFSQPVFASCLMEIVRAANINQKLVLVPLQFDMRRAHRMEDVSSKSLL